MKSDVQVAAPPPKPLMVFDGDCNFCTLWIRRWQQMTGEAVDYRPSQDPQVAAQFPEISPQQFKTSVQLIETDGAVYSGAEAVFRTLAYNPYGRWPLDWYESFRPLADLTEWAYRLVAENRTFFSRLTRWFWGRHVEQPPRYLTRWIFLRLLGAIYLVAFISLWTQIGGLIGHDGILPADRFMADIRQQCDAQGIGWNRYHLCPTLCWFNSSDGFLEFQCAAGTGLALLLIAGMAPAPCLFLLWLLYLSLSVVGQDFLGFQWDILLLETGFLAIFLAPWQWLPCPAREAPPSDRVLWLLRLLLFKLMFSSGCVKLLSGDPNWWNLTALTFHYQTQPLPTWIGWYFAQAPLWFQKLSCVVMFVIELGAPILILGPRRLRFVGAAALAFLQILILLTGNYTFFNWLTLALCLLLLDDFILQKILPVRFRVGFAPNLSRQSGHVWPRPILIALTIIVLPASLFILAATLEVRSPLFAPAAVVARELAPFRTIGNYGLFAVMTTRRDEIIVEGSNDGAHWLPYEFKYKPGDLTHPPAFVAPGQPRLDWQMWFAALGNYQETPWFGSFCERLLQGSPPVLALLKKNPFPGHSPRYIRAEFYDYQFTNAAERRATGAWWRRQLIGEYLPPVSLRQ
jgi:predicted DCC family thiol-disulfide oxidoreductase YuxK